MTHSYRSRLVLLAASHVSLLIALADPRAHAQAPEIWTEANQIDDPAATAEFHFGGAVALDGDTLAVTQRGDVQVFVRAGASWTPQAVLHPTEPHDLDMATIAIDGDNLVFGRPYDSSGPALSSLYGFVYVYHRSGTTWTLEWITGGGPADMVGTGVAIRGDVMLVCGQDSIAETRVHRRSGTIWPLEASLDLSTSPPLDQTTSVALEHDVALVCGRQFSATNAYVRYYRHVAGSWVVQQTFSVADAWFIAVDGDTLVAGAPEHDAFGTDAGAAFVYVLRNGAWQQEATLVPCDSNDELHFGRRVAIDGSTVVVAAQTSAGPLSSLGGLHVFSRTSGVWTERQKLTLASAQTTSGFGLSAALSGSTIAGGVLLDDGAATNSGAVYVFERTSPTASIFCLGDGTGTACPCGNDGDAGHGCGNSFDPDTPSHPVQAGAWNPVRPVHKPVDSPGARLDGYGLASVGDDHVVMSCIGVPPGSTASLFQGSAQQNGGLGVQDFDGLRCIGGSLVRIGTRASCAGNLLFPESADAKVSALGGIPAGGGTFHYQVLYSDSGGPCGTHTNFSNGVSLTWVP